MKSHRGKKNQAFYCFIHIMPNVIVLCTFPLVTCWFIPLAYFSLGALNLQVIDTIRISLIFSTNQIYFTPLYTFPIYQGAIRIGVKRIYFFFLTISQDPLELLDLFSCLFMSNFSLSLSLSFPVYWADFFCFHWYRT